MKKTILLIAVILMAGMLSGQTVQKGSLVSIHVTDVKLQPDVPYNQWKDFILTKYIPKVEETLQGDLKLYLLEGIRGEKKHEVGFLYVFKTQAARDKYLNDDGSPTETGKQTFAKIDDVRKEFVKYEKTSSFTFTDWIVQ